MFKTRLLSGIVLVIVALLTLISGGDVLLATLAMVSVIGMSELYNLSGMRKSILGITGYLAAASYYLLLRFFGANLTAVFLIAFLIILMGIYVFTYPRYNFTHVTQVFFGFMYVAVMLSCLYRIRKMPSGAYLVWLVFISSWGCDTAAYCSGMLLGRHKLAPSLSPKKSIEGAIGGVLGAALLGALYAVILRNLSPLKGADPMLYAAVCAVGAVISQIGDLAASAIKRNHGIKDYGHLIPGHGGILDRFDSVILAAPVVYYMILGLL